MHDFGNAKVSRGRRILVLSSDEFGADVAGRLTGLGSVVVHDVSADTHPSSWPSADLIVLAGRDRPCVADAVDETSFQRGLPWFPVSVHGSEIQVGPVVRPGHSACHGCLTRGPEPRRAALPADEYAQDHVGIAVGMAYTAAREAFGELGATDVGGTVRVFSRAGGAHRRAGAVTAASADDDCRRCGGTAAPQPVGTAVS
ncbi:hypothetical protein [Angustibacter luteus]|uniref:THIF-type NAD/FAD binding fold domain-containing protein n=1 Tax=Angustibacter luteus TaxID=658456 RepID=A0ABW1J9K9_9ACTN